MSSDYNSIIFCEEYSDPDLYHTTNAQEDEGKENKLFQTVITSLFTECNNIPTLFGDIHVHEFLLTQLLILQEGSKRNLRSNKTVDENKIDTNNNKTFLSQNEIFSLRRLILNSITSTRYFIAPNNHKLYNVLVINLLQTCQLINLSDLHLPSPAISSVRAHEKKRQEEQKLLNKVQTINATTKPSSPLLIQNLHHLIKSLPKLTSLIFDANSESYIQQTTEPIILPNLIELDLGRFGFTSKWVLELVTKKLFCPNLKKLSFIDPTLPRPMRSTFVTGRSNDITSISPKVVEQLEEYFSSPTLPQQRHIVDNLTQFAQWIKQMPGLSGKFTIPTVTIPLLHINDFLLESPFLSLLQHVMIKIPSHMYMFNNQEENNVSSNESEPVVENDTNKNNHEDEKKKVHVPSHLKKVYTTLHKLISSQYLSPDITFGLEFCVSEKSLHDEMVQLASLLTTDGRCEWLGKITALKFVIRGPSSYQDEKITSVLTTLDPFVRPTLRSLHVSVANQSSVYVHLPPNQLQELTHHPILTNVRELDVLLRVDGDIEILSTSPYLTNLSFINLFRSPRITTLSLSHIAKSHMVNLTAIKLYQTFIWKGENYEEHFHELFHSKNFESFTKFNLRPPKEEDVSFLKQFSTSPYMSKLTEMRFKCSGTLDDRDSIKKIFLNNPNFPKSLTKLDLSGGGLTDEDLRTISQCPYLTELEDIRLEFNPDITDEGIRYLVSSPYIHNVQQFWLFGNKKNLSPAILDILYNAPTFFYLPPQSEDIPIFHNVNCYKPGQLPRIVIDGDALSKKCVTDFNERKIQSPFTLNRF